LSGALFFGPVCDWSDPVIFDWYAGPSGGPSGGRYVLLQA